MNKAVLQLETLTCPSCIKKIEGTLSRTTGVESVKVLFNLSKVKVDYDGSQVTAEELQKTIEKLGYRVEKVKSA